MPQFFPQPQALTVRDIVALTGAVARDGANLDYAVTGIAAIDRARSSDLVFVDSPKYAQQLQGTGAGVCLAGERLVEHAPASVIVLRSAQPFRHFVMVARTLYPGSLRPISVFDGDAMGPGAHVHATAEIEDGVIVDPGAVIGRVAAIGSGTVIGANSVIGPGVQIGRNCSIGPGVTIVHALIGDGVIIHAGARIGQDGYRYQPSASGHTKVPQIGRVVIQDNVEIGSNTTVDRGGIGDTVIGEGTKIDNLVQIAHNCVIGRHCIIVGQVGLSGSVVLGDYVTLAGQVGIADHIAVGEGAVIGAQSGVFSDVPAGEKQFGYPAMPGRRYLRVVAERLKRD